MSAAPEPVTVFWEDDPSRARTVRRCCKVCYPNGETPDEVWVAIVSRMGVAHQSSGYGETDCGRDATGPDWWWEL